MENNGAKKARALFPKSAGQVVSSGPCYGNTLSGWSHTGHKQTHPVFSSRFTTVVVSDLLCFQLVSGMYILTALFLWIAVRRNSRLTAVSGTELLVVYLKKKKKKVVEC